MISASFYSKLFATCKLDIAGPTAVATTELSNVRTHPEASQA